MEKVLYELLNRIPNLKLFVMYLIDKIKDGNNGKGDFTIGSSTIDFCIEIDEQDYWHDNILTYPFLFSASILKYYSEKTNDSFLNEKYLLFINSFEKVLDKEKDVFFKLNNEVNKTYLNIRDYIFNKSDFALVNSNTISSQNDRILKKSIKKKEKEQPTAIQTYREDYVYTLYNGKLSEDLEYDIEGIERFYSQGTYASVVQFTSPEFRRINNVISIARINKGYIYIVEEKNTNYLRAQGYNGVFKLIRKGKKPIMVKALGDKVAVLMSDGTVTTNFSEDLEGIFSFNFGADGRFSEIKL